MPLGQRRLLLFLRVGAWLCFVAPAFPWPAATCLVADEVLPPDAEAVADVQAGRLDVARAAWWVFTPAPTPRDP